MTSKTRGRKESAGLEPSRELKWRNIKWRAKEAVEKDGL
jgi:hypothetical protein